MPETILVGSCAVHFEAFVARVRAAVRTSSSSSILSMTPLWWCGFAHAGVAGSNPDVPVPAIDAIRQEGLQVPVSIDTFYAEVAAKAVAAGANIVNDVSGGTLDPNMHETVADAGVSYVLMHMRGTPETMQSASNVAYGDVCRDVAQSLQASCDRAVRAGIESWRIILDPGIGFAKTPEGSTELVANLPTFRSHISEPYKALPILLGASRKKFLGHMIGRPEEDASGRDWASCAINAIGALHGANIIRTHNVRAAKDATMVADAVIDRAGRERGPYVYPDPSLM